MQLGDGDVAFGGPDRDDFIADAGAVVARGGVENDEFDGAGDARQVFFAGPGNDRANTTESSSGLSVLHGEDGDDWLSGWASLDGGDGADFLSSEAADSRVTLSGGDGDDDLLAVQSAVPTADRVSCGPGADSLRIQLPLGDQADGFPDDCEETYYGIDGTDGADVIDGTPYDDWVRTAHGADTVRTFGGDDFVNGAGVDTGRDVFWFGAGDDSVRVIDGAVDVVHCGAGYDRVTAEEIDVVADDCEYVGNFVF